MTSFPTSPESGDGSRPEQAGQGRRRRTHSEEDILSAVRDLLLEHGPRGVTTSAVSQRSGAPTGSLYHRFGSRSTMVAELWVQTIRRFHGFLLAAVEGEEPGLSRALAVAKAVIDFSARSPQDARLLLIASREELQQDDSLPPALADALRTLNVPVEELTRQLCRELYGRVTPTGLERVALATAGLPYTAIRRRLLLERDPAGVWPMVEQGARAILLGP